MPPDFRFGAFRPQRGRRVTMAGMPLTNPAATGPGAFLVSFFCG
jgi:hypothetical protein